MECYSEASKYLTLYNLLVSAQTVKLNLNPLCRVFTCTNWLPKAPSAHNTLSLPTCKSCLCPGKNVIEMSGQACIHIDHTSTVRCGFVLPKTDNILGFLNLHLCEIPQHTSGDSRISLCANHSQH